MADAKTERYVPMPGFEVCEECGEPRITQSRGEHVCQKCGAVQELPVVSDLRNLKSMKESPITEERDKFRENEPAFGRIRTLIGNYADYHSLDARGHIIFKRMKRAQDFARLADANGRRNYHVSETAKKQCEMLNLNYSSLADEIKDVYAKSLKADPNIIRKSKLKPFCACCVRAAASTVLKRELSPRYIAKVTGIDKKRIYHTWKVLHEEGLVPNLSGNGAVTEIGKYCSELKLPLEVKNRAEELYKEFRAAMRGTMNIMPQGAQGGAVYAAAYERLISGEDDNRPNQADVAAVVKVTEVTLRKYAKLILGDLFEDARPDFRDGKGRD